MFLLTVSITIKQLNFHFHDFKCFSREIFSYLHVIYFYRVLARKVFYIKKELERWSGNLVTSNSLRTPLTTSTEPWRQTYVADISYSYACNEYSGKRIIIIIRTDMKKFILANDFNYCFHTVLTCLGSDSGEPDAGCRTIRKERWFPVFRHQHEI